MVDPVRRGRNPAAGEFLLRQRADNLHELSLEQLIRQQHEVSQEQDHDQLVRRRRQAYRRRPDERAGLEPWLCARSVPKNLGDLAGRQRELVDER